MLYYYTMNNYITESVLLIGRAETGHDVSSGRITFNLKPEQTKGSKAKQRSAAARCLLKCCQSVNEHTVCGKRDYLTSALL